MAKTKEIPVYEKAKADLETLTARREELTTQREQLHARLGEINGEIESAQRAGQPVAELFRERRDLQAQLQQVEEETRLQVYHLEDARSALRHAEIPALQARNKELVESQMIPLVARLIKDLYAIEQLVGEYKKLHKELWWINQRLAGEPATGVKAYPSVDPEQLFAAVDGALQLFEQRYPLEKNSLQQWGVDQSSPARKRAALEV